LALRWGLHASNGPSWWKTGLVSVVSQVKWWQTLTPLSVDARHIELVDDIQSLRSFERGSGTACTVTFANLFLLLLVTFFALLASFTPSTLLRFRSLGSVDAVALAALTSLLVVHHRGL